MRRRASRRAAAPASRRASTGSTDDDRAPRRRSARPGRRTGRRRPAPTTSTDDARRHARGEQHGPDAGQRGAPEQRRLPQRHAAARRQRDTLGRRRRARPGARRRAAVDGLAVERHARSCRRRASRCRSRGGAARRPPAVRARSRRSRRTTAPTRARPRPRPRRARPRRRPCSTTPAPSWPSTIGVGRCHSPLTWCRSVPQIPTAAMRTTTSSRAGLGEIELHDLERLADRAEDGGAVLIGSAPWPEARGAVTCHRRSGRR